MASLSVLSVINGSKWVQRNSTIIGAVIAIGLLWYFFKPYFKIIFGLIPEDAQFTQGGGDITAEFYAKRRNIAANLKSVLNSNALLAAGRCDALYDLLQRNDNELRLICNQYKNRYGTTLVAEIGQLSTDDCGWFALSQGLNVSILKRLNVLQLG